REFQFIDPAQVPDNYLKDGKPVLPFNSAIYFCPADGSQPAIVCHSKGSDFYFGGVGQQPKPVFNIPHEVIALGEPTISPDGSILVFVMGRLVGEREVEGATLIAVPMKENAAIKQPARIALGPVSSPSFSPDSTKVTYLKVEANGKHSIYIANITGGVET